jgi:transposase
VTDVKSAKRLAQLAECGLLTGSFVPPAACDVGVSGRAMLEALIAGETDPDRLAALAKGRLRATLPELRLDLAGRFGGHHRMLLRIQLGTSLQRSPALNNRMRLVA